LPPCYLIAGVVEAYVQGLILLRFAEDYSLAPLIDDCTLLGNILDDCLRSEVGPELFNKVERIRSLAQCAAQLANKHDAVSVFLLFASHASRACPQAHLPHATVAFI